MEAVSINHYTAADVAYALGKRKRSGDWWMCSCPCTQNHAHGDKHPSLSVKDADDGNLIVKCQTGCNPRDIYQAIRAKGIPFRETSFSAQVKPFSIPKGNKRSHRLGRQVAQYDYTTEQGEIIVSKLRFEPKDFRIEPAGRSKDYVLYNLPLLKIARENKLTVYIPEGEKDCDALRLIDLISTCNIEGASLGEVKWRDSYTQSLWGLDVVILADNDEAGRNHARAIAALLYGKAASVKIVEFPELPEKGDVSDYLKEHTKEELLAKVEATPLYTPPNQLKTFEFTDVGNAARLAHYSQGSLGYCEKWDAWMAYNGKVWKKGDLLAVKMAKEVAKLVLKEAELYQTEEQQQKVYKHYQSSQRGSSIKNMLYLARDEVTQIDVSQLDAQPDLFNANNGTIDLRTGRLRPPSREDLITRCSPIDYSPEARAPRWNRFLTEIFEGNQELIDYIQRAAGYSITGHSSERAFFILHGVGRNGKSTFVETLSHVLGEDYAAGMPTESLYAKKADGGVPNDTARLRGSRFVYASEGEDGKHLAIGKIKQLTGNEKITTRHMRGEWFDYLVAFKVWFSTNHKPEITESAAAIWDRVKLVPFNRRFTDEEKDPHLRLALIDEAPGILAWAVEGARKWYEQGLGDCEAVKAATSDYRKDSDLVGRFLEERCEQRDGEQIQAKKLYEVFELWAKEQGITQVMTREALSKRLREKGFANVQRTGGKFFWQGLTVQRSEDEDNLPNLGW